MSDDEILASVDFYDFLGSFAVFYTNDEKVKYYRDNFEQNEDKHGK